MPPHEEPTHKISIGHDLTGQLIIGNDNRVIMQTAVVPAPVPESDASATMPDIATVPNAASVPDTASATLPDTVSATLSATLSAAPPATPVQNNTANDRAEIYSVQGGDLHIHRHGDQHPEDRRLNSPHE